MFIITCQSEAISEALLYFCFAKLNFYVPPLPVTTRCYRADNLSEVKVKVKEGAAGSFSTDLGVQLAKKQNIGAICTVSELRCRHFPTCASPKFSAKHSRTPDDVLVRRSHRVRSSAAPSLCLLSAAPGAGGEADQVFQKLDPSNLITHNVHQFSSSFFLFLSAMLGLVAAVFTFTLNDLTETKEL